MFLIVSLKDCLISNLFFNIFAFLRILSSFFPSLPAEGSHIYFYLVSAILSSKQSGWWNAWETKIEKNKTRTKKNRLRFWQTTALLTPKHRHRRWAAGYEPTQPFPSLRIRPMEGNCKQASANLNQTVTLRCRSPGLVWHSTSLRGGFRGGKQSETISLPCREKLLSLYWNVTLKPNWSF